MHPDDKTNAAQVPEPSLVEKAITALKDIIEYGQDRDRILAAQVLLNYETRH